MTKIEKQVVKKVLDSLVKELHDFTKRERIREGILNKDGEFLTGPDRGVEFTEYRLRRELERAIPFFKILQL